jgi:hypothetical protein
MVVDSMGFTGKLIYICVNNILMMVKIGMFCYLNFSGFLLLFSQIFSIGSKKF